MYKVELTKDEIEDIIYALMEISNKYKAEINLGIEKEYKKFCLNELEKIKEKLLNIPF